MDMNRTAPKTRVAFRAWLDEGDVIAIMPDLPGTTDPYTCESYQHMGQHSSCDPYGLIQATRPAKPAEYADLLAELTSIGYCVQVVRQVNTAQSLARRQRVIARLTH